MKIKFIFAIFLFVFLTSCMSREPVTMKIQSVSYDEAIPKGDIWDFEKLDDTSSLSDIVLKCKLDFKKEVNLYGIRTEDEIAYLLFEVTWEDDSMIAYAYDLKTKKLKFKFYIPMA